MTRRKDMENSCGLMVDAIEVNGQMVNNMAKELMSQVLDKRDTENGKKESELDGLVGLI